MRNCVVAGLMGLIVGCSGGGGGTTVDGKVTFADGAPLTKGVVVYTGDPGTYRGAIRPDGSYTLEKVPKGDYSVAITGAQEGGEPPGEMQYDEQGNYVEPKVTPPTPLIHSKYSDSEKSGLRTSVPGDYAIQVEKPE